MSRLFSSRVVAFEGHQTTTTRESTTVSKVDKKETLVVAQKREKRKFSEWKIETERQQQQQHSRSMSKSVRFREDAVIPIVVMIYFLGGFVRLFL